MNSFFDVHLYDEVDSTNDIVKRMAKSGAPEGFVAIAKRQGAWRGRMGRAFFSPEGGLYMSVLLRPRLSPQRAPRVTTMAAVAVCEAIEGYCGIEARIKWVNDIIAGGRKVCGILAESASSGDHMDYAALGIGVNVLMPEGGYPEDIKNKAGALFKGECPQGARDDIARSILERLGYYYERLDDGDYALEYARRSLITGRRVEILYPSGKPVRALVLGVDAECALEVEYENGEKGKLASGEVSVKFDYE